jgi:hypothetical protein
VGPAGAPPARALRGGAPSWAAPPGRPDGGRTKGPDVKRPPLSRLGDNSGHRPHPGRAECRQRYASVTRHGPANYPSITRAPPPGAAGLPAPARPRRYHGPTTPELRPGSIGPHPSYIPATADSDSATAALREACGSRARRRGRGQWSTRRVPARHFPITGRLPGPQRPRSPPSVAPVSDGPVTGPRLQEDRGARVHPPGARLRHSYGPATGQLRASYGPTSGAGAGGAPTTSRLHPSSARRAAAVHHAPGTTGTWRVAYGPLTAA